LGKPIQNYRPLEDEIEKRITFQSKPAFMSHFASEVLRLELDLLTNVRSKIYSTEFLEYFTKAGLCTIRPNQPYIIKAIQRRLASYGYETSESHISMTLDHYLDLIFMRDEYQQKRLSAKQFLPKHVRVNKRSIDKKVR
jgi:hypothetical protein